MEESKETIHWWAMSAVYNRSLKAQAELNARGIETFIPMRHVMRVIGGRKRRQIVPAVNNLLFARTTAESIRSAKHSLPYLHYLIERRDGHGYPVIVPDDRMADFIAVASTESADPIYFSPSEVRLTAGEHVRIHGGPFDGVSGTFCRVCGKRNRRLVVVLDGIMGVAVTVQPEYVERI